MTSMQLQNCSSHIAFFTNFYFRSEFPPNFFLNSLFAIAPITCVHWLKDVFYAKFVPLLLIFS